MSPLPDLVMENPPIMTSEGEVIPANAESEPFRLPPMETQETAVKGREPRRRPVNRVSVGEDPDNEKRKIRRGKGQPSEDEWAEFFSRYALDWLMEGYIWLCFRGVDQDALPEGFWESLEADEEDIASIADALSSFTHGTTLSKRYGRKIVSSAALLDATHALTMWAIQVNRAASRVKKAQGITPVRNRKESRGNSGRQTAQAVPDTAEPGRQQANGTSLRYPEGIRIINPGGA